MEISQQNVPSDTVKISDIDWRSRRNADRHRHLLSGLGLEVKLRYSRKGPERLPAAEYIGSTRQDRNWRDKAECLGVETELFYPDRGVSAEPAQAVCSACTVREECLLDAIQTDESEPLGVRGGKSGRERRMIRWALNKAMRESSLGQRQAVRSS